MLNSSPDVPKQFSSTANEFYHLQVDDSKELITITGQAPAGVFYGVQTLLALVKDSGEVPKVSITDSPRYSYRGLMMDVGRNFIPKHEILKLLDVMAMYKMNKFHFHLSDNEGWRLEIPGLEELTTVRLLLYFCVVFTCRIYYLWNQPRLISWGSRTDNSANNL